MATPRVAVVLIVLSLFAEAAAARQADALDPVRDLYAAAQYEKALSILDRLKVEPATAKPVDIDRYRVLCLMALGRSKEADVAIEAILTSFPLYRPNANEASPAVRAAYSAVRQRILPALARAAYSGGREAFDRRDLAGAVEKFEQALKLASDAQGDVLSAEVVQSSHPQYNAVLAKAALAWKYEPAWRNGEPARARQRVDVVLKPK